MLFRPEQAYRNCYVNVRLTVMIERRPLSKHAGKVHEIPVIKKTNVAKLGPHAIPTTKLPVALISRGFFDGSKEGERQALPLRLVSGTCAI